MRLSRFRTGIFAAATALAAAGCGKAGANVAEGRFLEILDGDVYAPGTS
jgi:hypothetical protein